MKILLLSTENAARSILLGSIFNQLGAGRIAAFSAGTMPAEMIYPETAALLHAKGIPMSDTPPQILTKFTIPGAPEMDAVISLSAHARIASADWPGAPLTCHWGIGNPAAIASTKNATKAAFEVAFSVLMARAKALLSLDFERLNTTERQYHFTRIGEASLVM